MLTDSVESYLKLRRALGFDLRNAASLLRRFALFGTRLGETRVHARTAVDWSSRASSPEGRDRRLKTVIRFARHVHAEDDRHEIPADGVFGHHRQRRIPFIFSSDDVNRLLEQAGRLGPPGSLRPATYFTLFALLSATGLRISNNGRELFYRSISGSELYGVSIRTSPELRLGEPRLILQGDYLADSDLGKSYDVLKDDGQSFVIIRQDVDYRSARQLIVVEHWFSEIKRLFER